jgi:hypothetical protein
VSTRPESALHAPGVVYGRAIVQSVDPRPARRARSRRLGEGKVDKGEAYIVREISGASLTVPAAERSPPN